jgi:hypothetical protein
MYEGDLHRVSEIECRGLEDCKLGFVCISRNLEIFGDGCFSNGRIQLMVFEANYKLRSLNCDCFAFVRELSGFSIPAKVDWVRMGDCSEIWCFEPLASDVEHGSGPAETLARSALDPFVKDEEEQTSTSREFGIAADSLLFSTHSFSDCLALKWICIPNRVGILSSKCFWKCESLREVTFESDSKLDRIESEVFRSCSSLCSICIPRSVTILCSECFQRCISLREITFESDSKLARIESEVFVYCSSLSSICIPRSVTILCSKCFQDCGSLRDVTFESDSKLDRIESEVFRDCSSLSSICIPRSVTILCSNCFEGCERLGEVSFESDSKLSRIESEVFSSCSSLSSICIPRSVTILCSNCFEGCQLLGEVTFESDSKLSRIESDVFDYCLTLSTISIPDSLQALLAPLTGWELRDGRWGHWVTAWEPIE